MKILSAFFVTLLLTQSCQTNKEQSKEQKLLFRHCDELNIVYYSKDTFVYKTFDTSSIKNFAELITINNEVVTDTCETTEYLIFKNKGKQIFSAQVSIKNIRDTISCNNITYFWQSKMYRHSLTYQTGMGIDEIYWRKVDPTGNPSTGLDTTKFKYEDYKNNH